MSETPSLYDLQQDARILPMEQILSQAAEPPTGVEFSYPVVGQAMNSEMWRWVNRGVGDGIIDDGGRPYWLTSLNNATNTAVVQVSTTRGTANALVGGFFHQLNSNKTINLPMPSSGTVTYRVALTYDQTRESATEGPVTLQVYSGALPTGARYKHSVLWEVRRSANQLLTDATVRRLRVRTAPTILVWERDHLPDVASVAWGTLAFVHQTGEWWIARGESDDAPSATRWENAANSWSTIPLSSPQTSPYGVAAGKAVDGMAFLSGSVGLPSGQTFSPRTAGYRVATLPVALRPSRDQHVLVNSTGELSPSFGRLKVFVDGSLYFFPQRNVNWFSLDGVQYRLDG